MRAYWWARLPNFGDRLGQALVEHLAGRPVTWSEPGDAELVVTGSVLDVLPATGWSGTVAGAGALHEHLEIDLRAAKVLGLRGRLSAERVQRRPGALVLGDPALLASELVQTEPGRHELGVVAHWTDSELADRFARWDPLVIDTRDDPLSVVAQIGSCKKIVASSLHGVIVADSFGLPRRVEPFAAMGSRDEGGDFKFRDYASAINQPIEWSKPGGQIAPPQRIAAIRAELFDMLRSLRAL